MPQETDTTSRGTTRVLILHRAERTDTLADALADILSTPLPDPFATEIVAVPARGMQRWLTQRLSTVLGATDGDGVAANIAFPSPGRLVDDALAAVAGTSADDDPWHPSRVQWALLDVIDSSLGQPWCAALSRHLGYGRDDHRAGRRFATARRLAELLQIYGRQRPRMIAEWAQGHDTDGLGTALPDYLCWQAELWRRLRERIGADSPAQRLDEMCAQLRAEPGLLDLPARLSLFGPTRISAVQEAVIEALAEHREVHVWLPHPSPVMWRNSTASTDTTRTAAVRRADDRSADDVRHPLLVAFGRDARELQDRLRALEHTEIEHPTPEPPLTLLGRLQADIRADRPLAAGSATADGTVQIHACHGPSRQVEVLRETLLRAFADDPGLEPRDVLVVCPDVDLYAPLVQAAFGAGIGEHPGHGLRVRIADRSLQQTNPVLSVLSTLLSLADGRVTAGDVLGLAATAPLRRMFSFDDNDLERLQRWTAEAGARWGLGVWQRTAFGLDLKMNTFASALDRVLLGVAADGDGNDWLSLASPLDDVESNDIDLAGRFAEYIDRLAVALLGLRGPHPAGRWSAELVRSLDLLADTAPSDTWQITQAHREIAAAVEHGDTARLTLTDVRSMLTSRLAGRPGRANFRTGDLTVCEMAPLRSVPHRVVALLGLDDDVFPRAGHPDGDDILKRDPCVGERDPRSEDRALLLDAVMSAEEKLLVFFTGADPITGARRPPSVPVGQLRDALAAMVGPVDTEHLVRRHPLQPFDARNFDPVAPFSFDRAALDGAEAARRHTTAPVEIHAPAALVLPEPSRPTTIDLDDLIAYFEDPVQGFLRQRLNIRLPEPEEGMSDALDITLDPLTMWSIGQRVLDSRLAGVAAEDCWAAEWRRGVLPPERFGRLVVDEITSVVEGLVRACEPVHRGTATALDVRMELDDGRALVGTVTGVHDHVIATATYSKVRVKQRIRSWIRLLAVAAARPDGQWQAVTTGRRPAKWGTWRSTMLAPGNARDELARLVDLRERGVREALPLFPDTSEAYAVSRRTGSSVETALENADRRFSSRFGERNDEKVRFLFGSDVALDALTATPPTDTERLWFDEPSRFGAVARRLWDPLLAAEKQGRP